MTLTMKIILTMYIFPCTNVKTIYTTPIICQLRNVCNTILKWLHCCINNTVSRLKYPLKRHFIANIKSNDLYIEIHPTSNDVIFIDLLDGLLSIALTDIWNFIKFPQIFIGTQKDG